MSRYREIAAAEMTPAQKRVHDQIVAGKRGRFGGPFQHPDPRRPRFASTRRSSASICAGAPRCRTALSELAIITHRAVLARAIRMVCACAACRGGRRPGRRDRGDPHRRHAGVHRQGRGARLPRRATRSSAPSGCPTRASPRRSSAFGEQGVVELIAIIGYYTLIGNTLNVFQVGLPAGETPPFPGVEQRDARMSRRYAPARFHRRRRWEQPRRASALKTKAVGIIRRAWCAIRSGRRCRSAGWRCPHRAAARQRVAARANRRHLGRRVPSICCCIRHHASSRAIGEHRHSHEPGDASLEAAHPAKRRSTLPGSGLGRRRPAAVFAGRARPGKPRLRLDRPAIRWPPHPLSLSSDGQAAAGRPRSSSTARRRAKADGSGSCSPSTMRA